MSRNRSRHRAPQQALAIALLAGVTIVPSVSGTIGAQTPAPQFAAQEFSDAVPSANAASQQPLQLPARLSAGARLTIEQLADSLRVAGIPFSPLYDKAAEGVLKGADDARIVAAIRTLARELGTASQLLGPSAPVSDIVSAASALRAGVPVSAAQQLVKRRLKSGEPAGRLSLSFIILADFASRGVPIDAAVSAVDGLLARGAGGAELTAFRAGVERDLLAGRDARATLSTRAEGVLRRP